MHYSIPHADEGDSEPVVDKRPIRSRRLAKSMLYGMLVCLWVKIWGIGYADLRGEADFSCEESYEAI